VRANTIKFTRNLQLKKYRMTELYIVKELSRFYRREEFETRKQQ